MRFAAVLLLLPTCMTLAAEPFTHEQQIREYVQPYLDHEVCNALSIGVIHGDRQWIAHFGQLSDEQPESPHDDTMYEIGSVSKVFTGLLLAEAVQAGVVKLDQPIGSMVNQLQQANPAVGESITLLQLATHNSGLPRLPDNLAPANPSNPYADYGRDRLIDFLCRVKPNDQPDTVTAYSNLGVGLLGDLLAAEAAIDYDTLLKEKITKPLNMNDTTVLLSDAQRPRIAPPHNVGMEADTLWDFDALVGAGGIRSTVPDMLRFIEAVLQPPDTELGKAIELAWKRYVPSRDGQFAMGLGWHIAKDGSTRWHNGQTGGYHSMMLINRDLQAGVVVLGNTASGQIDTIGESIIQMLAGRKVKPPSFEPVKQVDQQQMERLVGKYQIVPGFILDVRLEKDRLMVQATNQPALRVYPASETRWKYRVVPAEITFELPAAGPATALTLQQNGREMRAPRITE
jgi:CubicO group peptidase (beta-lactamase class C family)